MTDLINLVGSLVDHGGATPLEGVSITATPSRRVTQTSAGEDALTDASTTTDSAGAFSLELVWAAGLRYVITYRVAGERIRRGTVDCDSWPVGATVNVNALPPVEGIPPSTIDDLRAWILEQIPTLTVADGVLYIDEEPS